MTNLVHKHLWAGPAVYSTYICTPVEGVRTTISGERTPWLVGRQHCPSITNHDHYSFGFGTQVITVVPLGNVWIVGNYKETQLTHVAIGQHAEWVS